MRPSGSRFLKYLFPFILSAAAAVPGCAGSSMSDPQVAADRADFPTGYRSWKKINRVPIIRETERQARDIYANEVALHRSRGKDFPVGSILVKEERIMAQCSPRPVTADVTWSEHRRLE